MPKNALLVKYKEQTSKNTKDISVIKEKLSDPEYIKGAVHRLAVIITEQLLDMGGIQDV